MKLRGILLLALLTAASAGAVRAFTEPQVSRTDPAAVEAARLEAASAPILPPSEWEYPPLADPGPGDRGYDSSSSHYARGRTLIIHVFINHPGVAWTEEERNAAGGKSNVAKDFYMARSPYAANMSFDDPAYYLWYNPSINWVVPEGPSFQVMQQAMEDAAGAIGFTDTNGNGSRCDELTLFLQNWGGGWDNVITVYQAHVSGRAFSDFYIGRCALYTNSGGNVWAHEWGHNYHACDEYVDGGHCWNCDCGRCTEGFYLLDTVDNGNCALPVCPQDIPCVMKYNSVDVAPCSYTTGQFSWTDGDGNGLLDEVKRITGVGSYVLIWELYHAGAFHWNNVTDGMVFSQRWNNWYVAGLRSPTSADYDMTLYGDNKHDFAYASSAYGGATIDFVVGDCNHSPIGNDHIALSHYTGDWSSYNLTWEGGDQLLYADGIQRSEWWWGGDVVRVWDVPLFGGEQVTFNLTNSSGNLDFGMALYKSNGAPYWAGRSSAQWQRDAAGIGGSESFTYTAPEDDVYGLVVWSNNAVDGWLELQIGPSPTTMAESTVYTSSQPLSLYNYDPYSNYWAFVGSRALGGNEMWVGLFDDPNYTQLLSEISWNGTPLKFFAADGNHGFSRDYLRVVPGPGTTSTRSEWEPGPQIHSGIEPLWWVSPHLGVMWDAYLEGGTEYFFRQYHDPAGALDTGIYLFSSADGDLFKNSIEAAASSIWRPPSEGGEWFSYTSSASDWYGLCQTAVNEASASTSLWLGPRLTFAESGYGPRSDRVVWGVEPVYHNYWNVFAARARPGETVGLNMYADDAYTTDYHLAGDTGHRVALVYGDFNHNPTGTFYSRTYRETGSGQVMHEWDGGTDYLTFIPGSTNTYDLTWPAGGVVEMWDIYIHGGISGGQSVTFEVTDLSGAIDLGIEVLSSYGYNLFWTNRDGGIWADANGVGGSEAGTLTFWMDDWFGFAVWNNNDAGGAYRIRLIDPGVNAVSTNEAPAFDLRVAAGNPFRDSVALQYTLAADGPVELAVYDPKGRLIRSLAGGAQAAGSREISWDGRDGTGQPVGSGVYFARLRSGGLEKTIKLVRSP